MCQTSLTLWFVCKFCRGSFGQVDAFIEHKKQKHFKEFQNTTSIVFEERELGELCPIPIKVENPLVDETKEPPIKIEVNDADPVNPFSSEIIDEPNLDIVEPKSELITYESEINPDNDDNFIGLQQLEQNPYVLLKRLTSEEIQSACVPQCHSTLLKCEQKNVANNSERRNSLVISSEITDSNKVDKCNEIEPAATFRNISTEDDVQLECKLCSKQFQSNVQLKIHVRICELYHNRLCVVCNRTFCDNNSIKDHRLRFHGTEEEKLSLYKFKCHLCRKQFRESTHLRRHLESHEKKKQRVTTTNSNSVKCSHPNCGKEFQCNQSLRLHTASIHLGVRPFSCSFPNCNKTFSLNGHLSVHLRVHTGERPFKCTVDNCNEAFITSSKRSIHHRRVHRI